MDREIAPVVMLMEGAGGDDRLMSVISGLACVISAGIKEIPRSAVHYNSEHVTCVDARPPRALSARRSTARRVRRQLSSVYRVIKAGAAQFISEISFVVINSSALMKF